MAGGHRANVRFTHLRSCGQRTGTALAQIWVGAGLRASMLCCLAVVLAGCSMSFPISPLMASSSKEEAGGTVTKASIANLLDPEDWRRAKAALSTALDPQGNGALVGWDNPDSGNKGSFRPVGKAYPLDSGICRVFLAEIDRKGEEQTLQGTACSDKQGQWTIAEAKPWKKI
jgi:surface antigen